MKKIFVRFKSFLPTVRESRGFWSRWREWRECREIFIAVNKEDDEIAVWFDGKGVELQEFAKHYPSLPNNVMNLEPRALARSMFKAASQAERITFCFFEGGEEQCDHPLWHEDEKKRKSFRR